MMHEITTVTCIYVLEGFQFPLWLGGVKIISIVSGVLMIKLNIISKKALLAELIFNSICGISTDITMNRSVMMPLSVADN